MFLRTPGKRERLLRLTREPTQDQVAQAAGISRSFVSPGRHEPPRKIVTVEVEQTVLRILDSAGTVLTVVARTNTEEVTRHKAYGTMNRSSTPL